MAPTLDVDHIPLFKETFVLHKKDKVGGSVFICVLIYCPDTLSE